MKVFELRAYLQERGVRGYSTLKKTELGSEGAKNCKEQEEQRRYEEDLRDTAVCSGCLGEQRIQRKIDEKRTISAYSRAP